MNHEPLSSNKVLLIGWDAADWKIINALIDQGKMPHTNALIERGVMGDMATLQPALSPMLWTSIATGKRPYKHGILGFSEPTPDGASVQPISQLGRKTKAIWNILNQNGLRSNVIGWWPSHPVENINGVMISNHYQSAIGPPEDPWPVAPGMIHPSRLKAKFAELRLNPNELLVEQVLPFVPNAAEIDQEKDRRLATVMRILAECASVHTAASYAIEHEPWDFTAVYYDAIDHFCHGFMLYHPPRRPHVPEHDFQLYRQVVETAYCFHDMMLGNLLSMVPDETTVIICSDHGFHSDHLRPHQLPKEPAAPALEHRDLGIFIMAGPGIKQDELIHGANLLDITPTVLSIYGLTVGEDMDGKVLVDAFQKVPEVSAIPSWDAVDGNDARLSYEQQFDPFAAKEAMDQLVALGYIEAPDDDRDAAVRNTVRELRYNEARAYMDGGHHAEAAAILAELYQNEPNQYRFGVKLCLCYRALGQISELRQLVERLTKDKQQAAATAADELKAMVEEIMPRQTASAELNEDNEIDFDKLEENEKQKYRDLHMLSRFNTCDLDYLMAWVHIAERNPTEALVHLRRAEKADPKRLGLHIQIGEALMLLRHWSDAESAYQRALQIDTLNPHANLGLARALLRQRRTEESIQFALNSINVLYHNPMSHFILGLGLWRMNQHARAAEAFRVAISLNPNFEQAHRLLAHYALKYESDPATSQEHWQTVKEIREERRTGGKVPVAETQGVLDDLVPDSDGQHKANVPEFDARPGPQALVDKADVPDHWQECVTIVAGLPRAGTSMMMQMIAAAGIPILSDGERKADEDNPRGYFELELATRLRQDQSWLNDAGGKAVKIVAQLLPWLPNEQAYRIVFMERDLDEVLASQQAMLRRLGRDSAQLSQEQLKKVFQQQVHQVRVWLASQPNIKVCFVSYRDSLRDPVKAAEKICAFLGGDLNVLNMSRVVDESLYRQRAASAPGR